MPRLVDCECPSGPHQFERICAPDELVLCPIHHLPCQQLWWQPSYHPSRTAADEKDAIVVFRKPDGTFSYPAINTKPTPPGCERLVMRSRREVEAFERVAGVRNESLWYDRNGRGFDDNPRQRVR